ncbi:MULTISPECIES: GntR family transcriptional regulator [unclassified Mesorhizobium]|uniref:GntR family transcriptional regulator n=1 Tax=unclassified Mesorhizobium TaxID=325217 RepID=UPI000963F31D|nr:MULTISPECIES: GntR family transcriptional regulator [unclassified Mesorhizobium]MBN9259155.1 GntR family transcriptional regulator [Mesorhizobium sp.]MBN9269388.1 GntR family transcriptional regulator [Mesorhizobium sp.]OJX80636.1 MAG: GntR family transcriptional regulator [Mesorhizobium sp. 65-26]
MQAAARRPRTNHLDLAQRILDVARQRGFEPGTHLPEQQIASLCSVSRTPVRAALRLLAEQGVVQWEAATGYRLAVDLAAQAAVTTELPAAEEDELAEAILRDRSARRLDQTVTASGLMRRYNADRKTVLKALTRLTDENLLDRAPGQSWLFRRAPDDPEAQGESYEFRLLLEPAALLAPGFRLDGARAAALRQGMEALAALPDPAFDTREFQRLDIEFHGMIADGSANRFITDALSDHLRLRRLPGIYAGINVFRLKQSLREHLTILDHLESRQYEVAADLLRVHLRLSRSQRPQAASRGAPALFGMISRPD